MDTEKSEVDLPVIVAIEKENNNVDRESLNSQLNIMINEKHKPKQNLWELISRLRCKDKNTTEVVICNSNMAKQKEDNLLRLFGALYGNEYIIHISLVNISMKDTDCMILVEVLRTCKSLQILNLESNSLSTWGIEMIADMAEDHPSLKELRVANQRMAVGAEAERALVNCLSQNKNITKLSHSFRDQFVAVLANRFIQRNLDLLRQKRKLLKSGSSDSVLSTLTPHPYPKREIPIEFKSKVHEKLQAIIDKMTSEENEAKLSVKKDIIDIVIKKTASESCETVTEIEPDNIVNQQYVNETEYICFCFKSNKQVLVSKSKNIKTSKPVKSLHMDTRDDSTVVENYKTSESEKTSAMSIMDIYQSKMSEEIKTIELHNVLHELRLSCETLKT